jgi:hypothetical protein
MRRTVLGSNAIFAAVLLALLSLVSSAAAQQQTLAGAAAAAAKARSAPAQETTEPVAPTTATTVTQPVTCDALLQHPLAWWRGSLPTPAERDQLTACLTGSGQHALASPSVSAAPSAPPSPGQNLPTNLNMMSTVEQPQWLCRDDPSRITDRCKMVPKETAAQTVPPAAPLSFPVPVARRTADTRSVLMYAARGKSLDVQIIDRQSSDTNYAYVVPGYSNSTSNTNVNCFGSVNNVNCSGSTRTTGSAEPARQVSYQVRGATFSLQLPDGRVAVVNCESKYALKGDYINRRSCRMPLVNSIQAEFDGDKAKLQWSVSIDGKKTESETYKILAVLDKP